MERDIEVRYLDQERGRGVVAKRKIKKGALVEVCPILFVFRGFGKTPDQLDQFELAWTPRKVAMAGGYAHFYNHSDTPNVLFERDLLHERITVIALRDIKKGEELCHRYACKPWWRKK